MNNPEQQVEDIVNELYPKSLGFDAVFCRIACRKGATKAIQMKQMEIDEVKIECERLTKILTRIQKNGVAVHEGEEIAALETRVEELEAEAERNKSDWAIVINYLDPAVLSTSSDKEKAHEVMKRIENLLVHKEERV